jgi:hypothetical protein
MRSSRKPARDSASGIVDACGPKSPDSHRAVWGLTSRPPVSPAGFPPVSRLPAGSSPSSAFLWFPFVRRSPVRSLRPLPGSGSPRFPSGFPFPWAIFTLALPRGGSAGVGPGRQGPRSPALPRPPRLDRAIRPHSRWAAARHDGMPPQNRRLRAAAERRTSPRPNRADRMPHCVKGFRRSFSRRVRLSGAVALRANLGPWPSSWPSMAVVSPHLQVVRPRFAAGAPPGPAASQTAGWQRPRNGQPCQARALGCWPRS